MTAQRASSAILIRDGRLLLVRRKFPPSGFMFAFPGGRAEAEETPEETAIREFQEETGITVRNPRAFAFYDLKSEDPASHFHLSVFLVDEEGSEEAEAADDALEAGWYLPAEIRDLPVPESVLACVERIEREILASPGAREPMGLAKP
jgi:ADP-ribose pyrophosphatase YjhB (NUDIX family)